MISSKPRLFACVTAGFVFLIGFLVLLGWMFGLQVLKSGLPDWPNVAPLTMVGFCLAAISIWCAASSETGTATGSGQRAWLNASRVSALLVTLIGCGRLGDYVLGWGLNCELLGFHDVLVAGKSPTHMAPATALGFALIGTALLLAGTSRGPGAFQFFVFACGLDGCLGCLRYAYGGEPLLPLMQTSAISAFCFLLLSAGAFSLRSDHGLMALGSGDSFGGLLVRRILPVAWLLTFVIGGIRLKLQEAGWFGTEAGVSLFALANLLLFTALVWVAAGLLNHSEATRRQADATLQTMRFGVDHAGDAIFWVSQTGLILYANEAACKRSGYALEELLDKTVFDLDPDFPAGIWPAHWVELQRCGSLTFETRHRRKDGSVFPVEVNANYTQVGTQAFNFAFVRDITERKQAELRIRQFNRTYAVLSDINQLIVREREPQALLENACRISVAKGGFRMAWVGLKAAPGQPLKLVAHAHATPETLALIEQILAPSEPGCAFTSQALATGHNIVCNDIEHDPLATAWSAAALQNGYRAMASFPLVVAGQATGTLNLYAGEAGFFDADELRLLDELAVDISFALEVSHREAERRIMEASHARLAMAVEQAAEAIVITDLKATMIYANPAFERISGYTSTEAIGQNPRILQSGKQDAEFYRQMWDVIKNGGIWRGHFTNKHKSGSLFEEEATISPLRDVSGKIVNYVAVKRDVTHEKQLENQVLQSQKMEAIGTLAGGIAHDFNNILAAMFGYTYLLQQDTVGNPMAQESVGEILRAATRAKELVQQILTFSRQREQKPEVIKLDSVIKEVFKFLRASVPAQIKIETKLSAEAPFVMADPTQIYQVAMNLATNAVHAIGDVPGRLMVVLDAFRPDPKLLEVHPQLRPILYARLSVADTGHGMDAKTLERVFEPFFTTKPVGKGTGLGLAVVHGIVEAHKGVITVESEVGQGTTFTLYLPAQAQAGSLSAVAVGQDPLGQGQKILVLDDETSLTDVLQKMLGRLNYQVTTSNDASEAMHLFREKPGLFDLVITDLTMPEMSGLQVAGQIHAIRPGLPIILVSGYSVSVAADQLLEAGICERLEKPVSPSVLAEVVARVLKRV